MGANGLAWQDIYEFLFSDSLPRKFAVRFHTAYRARQASATNSMAKTFVDTAKKALLTEGDPAYVYGFRISQFVYGSSPIALMCRRDFFP